MTYPAATCADVLRAFKSAWDASSLAGQFSGPFLNVTTDDATWPAVVVTMIDGRRVKRSNMSQRWRIVVDVKVIDLDADRAADHAATIAAVVESMELTVAIGKVVRLERIGEIAFDDEDDRKASYHVLMYGIDRVFPN